MANHSVMYCSPRPRHPFNLWLPRNGTVSQRAKYVEESKLYHASSPTIPSIVPVAYCRASHLRPHSVSSYGVGRLRTLGPIAVCMPATVRKSGFETCIGAVDATCYVAELLRRPLQSRRSNFWAFKYHILGTVRMKDGRVGSVCSVGQPIVIDVAYSNIIAFLQSLAATA